jgi:succinate dehydrogenase / fumarate reductase cytochrome b subunit
MTPARSLLASSIGKKVVMAATGVILFGFVVAHMLGNLQAYLGPAALNHYAETLRSVPALLWAARVVLIVSAALHVWAAYSLTRMNRTARPKAYRMRETRESTLASRTMRWSGGLLLAFIVYHLMHFTFGTPAVHPSFVRGDVYHNFVTGLRVLPVAVFYVAAMFALGFHMYHGVWSMMQTLGLSHPRYDRLRHRFAVAVTVVVVAGNVSFPLAVLAGIIRERSPAVASAATPAPGLPHTGSTDARNR